MYINNRLQNYDNLYESRITDVQKAFNRRTDNNSQTHNNQNYAFQSKGARFDNNWLSSANNVKIILNSLNSFNIRENVMSLATLKLIIIKAYMSSQKKKL